MANTTSGRQVTPISGDVRLWLNSCDFSQWSLWVEQKNANILLV